MLKIDLTKQVLLLDNLKFTMDQNYYNFIGLPKLKNANIQNYS